jgi:D-tyrosyl-tRNA(Tyr) deacylase
MRTVIQRVSEANVVANGKQEGKINKGFLILVGIEHDDSREDAEWLAEKISHLRIFQDQENKMNLSINQVGGEILVISQFTLHAGCKKGNRPSFIRAAPPEKAIPLYEYFKNCLSRQTEKEVKSGIFGADMQVSLVNDGPVTIWLDSKNKE